MRNIPSADDGGDESDSIFEFEGDAAPGSRSAHRVTGVISRALPVVLLTALLLVVGAQPNLALLFHRPAAEAPVSVTVVCDVPWAVIRVDGRGAAAHCSPGIAGALPMARLTMRAGQHTLLATADGFAPYPIYAVIHPQTPGIYLTQFTLEPQGAAQALAAVNAYFADSYSQVVTLPATLWSTLGLRQPPAGTSLLLQERFEAVALDSYEPFYSETTYQRPIAPNPGAVGVAVVVVEQVSISAGCGAPPLLTRRLPVLYVTRASVTFSARPGSHGWTATAPYALNPAAEITSTPSEAAAPATPAGLLALAATTALAAQPGDPGRLASEIGATPLAGTGAWAAGLTLSARGGAASGASWLYLAGRLVALNPAAQRITPHLPALKEATLKTLETLRATQTGQRTQTCPGS